jgi:photosystem II stability/assembly factor-like uncharacterized protein
MSDNSSIRSASVKINRPAYREGEHPSKTELYFLVSILERVGAMLYVATTDGIHTFTKKPKMKICTLVSSGLTGINVRCLCPEPIDSSRIYAGSDHGMIYASTDNGLNWKEMGKLGDRVCSLAATQLDGNTYVYAGTEPAKLFLSMDRCQSWHEMKSMQNVPSANDWHSPWGPPNISTIALNPRDGRTVYIGIEVGGVLKSADEGGSWREMFNGLHPDLHCLAVNYYNTKIIFAATGGGIYRTVSAGELWSDIGQGIDMRYAVSVAIHPAKPNITYLAIAMGPPGNQALLYRSEDYGESWSMLHHGLPYPMLKGVRRKGLVINPAAPAEVYVGTSDGFVFFSPTEGMKWERIANVSATVNALACK